MTGDGVNAVAPPAPLEAETPSTAAAASPLTGGGVAGGTGVFSRGGGRVRAGGFGGLMLLSLPPFGDSGFLVGSLFEAWGGWRTRARRVRAVLIFNIGGEKNTGKPARVCACLQSVWRGTKRVVDAITTAMRPP